MPKRKKSERRRILDQGFVKSLAHELRVEILTILTERTASPNELSKLLDQGLSQVSYHVKVLRDYERIELVRTEPRRGAIEHYYRASSKTLLPASAWRGSEKGLRTVIGAGLASDLFNDLTHATDAKKLSQADSHVGRLFLVLDAEGWENVRASAERFNEEAEDEQRASAARASKANRGAAGVNDYIVGLLAFEDSRGHRSGKAQPSRVSKSASANGKATAKGKSKRRSKSNGSKRQARNLAR